MKNHDKIERTANGRYVAWWRGISYGPYATYAEAFDGLWNGPIGDEMLKRQQELRIDRAAFLAAQKERQRLDAERAAEQGRLWE